MTGRKWFTEDDFDRALTALRTWFRDHPDVTVPGEAIEALGLPDMTGVPAEPGQRTPAHWRMHRQARRIQEHAAYAMRHEANLRIQAAGTGTQQ